MSTIKHLVRERVNKLKYKLYVQITLCTLKNGRELSKNVGISVRPFLEPLEFCLLCLPNYSVHKKKLCNEHESKKERKRKKKHIAQYAN